MDNGEILKEIMRVEDDMLECKEQLTKTLGSGSSRMDCLSAQIEEVSATLNMLSERIETLIAIFEAGEKFFKVIGWAGVIIKWIAITGGGLALIYHFVKTGSWK